MNQCNLWESCDEFESPMMAACTIGSLECVEFLVGIGRSDDLFVRCSKLSTPFKYACLNGFREIVSFILSCDNISVPIDQLREPLFPVGRSSTPLLIFTNAGDLQTIKLLVDRGVPIMDCFIIPFKKSENAFMVACVLGYIELVSFFINRLTSERNDFKSNLNLRNSCGRTAASLATDGYKYLNALSDEDLLTRSKDFQAAEECYLKILELLYRYGSDLRIADSNGHTPVYYACDFVKGSLKILRFLVSTDAKEELFSSSISSSENPFQVCLLRGDVSRSHHLSLFFTKSEIKNSICFRNLFKTRNFSVIKWFLSSFKYEASEKEELFNLLLELFVQSVKSNDWKMFSFTISFLSDIRPSRIFSALFSGGFDLSHLKQLLSHKCNEATSVSIVLRLVELGMCNWTQDREKMFRSIHSLYESRILNSIIFSRLNNSLFVVPILLKMFSSDDVSRLVADFLGICYDESLANLKEMAAYFKSNSYRVKEVKEILRLLQSVISGLHGLQNLIQNEISSSKTPMTNNNRKRPR